MVTNKLSVTNIAKKSLILRSPTRIALCPSNVMPVPLDSRENHTSALLREILLAFRVDRFEAEVRERLFLAKSSP